MTTENFSITSEAPDLLLKKMSELLASIQKAKEGQHKNLKAIEFYESLYNTMKFAWAYMVDMERLPQLMNRMQLENEFLKDHMRALQEKLTKYETIEILKVNGEFEKTCANVDAYLASDLYQKKQFHTPQIPKLDTK